LSKANVALILLLALTYFVTSPGSVALVGVFTNKHLTDGRKMLVKTPTLAYEGRSLKLIS
jgi:hypothetical protein